MRILQHRERKTTTEYQRVFDYLERPGAGFAFCCDESGVPLPGNPDSLRNFRDCLLGVLPVRDLGVRVYTHSWVEPAVGLCSCGERVVLDHFTCACLRCGRDYNSAGQELAGREDWGSETGESVADILMVDTDPFGGDVD